MKNCKACVCKRRRAPEASRQLKFLSRSCRTCAWHPRIGERCGASWWLTWRSLWARTSKIAGNSATSISTELPCNDLNLDWNFELNQIDWRTYTVASYPWQMEIPPMMFVGLTTFFSPRYFVIRFPPKLNPTEIRCVDGYFFTKLFTIAA